ncbi:hypothetical protein SD77_1436 [Bacillus badius]|uniref:Uncharacterized protein n=1 Tax=Bacillus badius TaxID=1455 RepID=A0ABR5ART4_BACBA|nr:hypothetical protein SD77_1436 [Bacillus badius]TDW01416.1 hypothetical protein B0G66_11138 [Bacillus badius]
MPPDPSILVLNTTRFIERFLCAIKGSGGPLNEPMAFLSNINFQDSSHLA